MSTIDTVTDDREGAVVPVDSEESAAQQRPPLTADERARQALGSERRSLLVPVLSTAVGALIAGVLALAVLGFNTLRDDIQALHGDIDMLGSDMNDGFARVDERFALIDERFALIDARFAHTDERISEINAVLLDHTDRLARIETLQHTHTHGAPQS